MATVAAINSLGGFEYNPRGNIWLNDDSNLGHKLLMKMGWSKGKGLGKNENGIKENIKVKIKSTGSGVGFKDDSFFKIQSTEYDSLLKSISENCSPKDRVLDSGGETSKQKNGGLEQRSRAFKNRLHYRKFVRGKDLSKYSEKDMKSIFILNKTSEKEKIQSVTEDSSVSLKKDPDPQKGQCTNVMDTYNSSLSISEYFALKIKEKKSTIPKICGGNADAQPIIYPDSGKLKNENASLISAETSPSKLKDTSGDAESESMIFINKELALAAPTVHKEKRKRLKEQIHFRNVTETDETNGVQEIKRANSSKPSKKRKMSVTDSVIACKEDKLCSKSFTDSNVDLFQPDPVESTCSALPDSTKDMKEKRKKLTKERRYKYIADTSEANEIQKIKKENSLKPSKKKKVTVAESVIAGKEDKLCSISLTDSDVDLSQPDPVESTCSALSDSTKDSVKKTKKQKQKHLTVLKSCLKRNFGQYNVKNVSFNEGVSYKVIDSEPECKIACITPELENSTVPIQMDTQVDNNKACLEMEKHETQVKLEESGSLSYSPCNKSSLSYNPWIESQRQAMKMKLYKNMLKNIKKHDILKSTNLLFIRGYGNWGY